MYNFMDMSTDKTDKTKVISLKKRQKKGKRIAIFEAFAGIGAQHKAISNLNFQDPYFEIVKTSEWDARAVIAYAQIHHHHDFKKKLAQIQNWKEERVNDYLKNRIFSLNSKKSAKVWRKDTLFKMNLVAANIVNKNISDIHSVRGKDLENIDLLFYSFPCQGLSIANMGRDQGIGPSSDSTSNVIWEIERILLESQNQKIPLPRYLILENVSNLLSKKHYPEYKKWLKFLKKLGYETRTLKLNGFDYNSIQIRNRVFGISIMNWKPKSGDEEFNEFFAKKYSKNISESQRKIIFKKILSSSDAKNDEIEEAIPNDTKSRMYIKDKCRKLDNEINSNRKYKWTFSTLSTKQDRWPNVGMVKISKNALKRTGKLDYRFITTREAYLMMGFTSLDFKRVKAKYKKNILTKKKILTKESLYRQAGNAIIVSVAEAIFKFIRDFERGKIWSYIGT